MVLNASNPTAQYLINHAALNVNCRPLMDNQHRIKMRRITGKTGAVKNFTAWHRTFNLPDDTNTFHVFVIGRHMGEDFNVGAGRLWWRELSKFCEVKGSYYNIYTEDGKEFPLTLTWTGNLENETMLVCVLDQPNIADLGVGDYYWRTYLNADFAEGYPSYTKPTGREVHVLGGIVTSSTQVLQWQRQLYAWRKKIQETGIGWTHCSINGEAVDDIPPSSFKIGDSIQVVYDGTVVHRYSFRVEDLKTYNSDLDKKVKYLIHPPKDEKDIKIQYRDDVDIYVKGPNGKGRYYHTNQENSIRMLTHRDYGIPVDYVSYFVERVDGAESLRDLTLEVVVRDSGLKTQLTFEHNRIHELYKLPDDVIVGAMLEQNANIPEFFARTLEASDYTRIMRNKESNITIDMVTSAYGYNAMAKLVADSPQRVTDDMGIPAAEVPWGLRANATFFEYDSNGLLLGITQHPAGRHFYPQYKTTSYVEGRSGVGGRTLDYVMGVADVPIREWASYRCYSVNLRNGKPVANTWKDVTNDASVVTEENGVIKWSLDGRKKTGLVLFDTYFLAYKTTIQHRNHTVWLDVTTGIDVEYPLPFEPGQIEVWLGDERATKSYSLVRDIDYIVKWPTIMINAKRYFSEGNTHTVTVRCTGFPRTDLTGETVYDTGWTMHNQLSYDDVFNVRDDHVVRIVVGGRIYDRSEVVTAEDTQYPADIKVNDGVPYAIYHVIAPIRGLVNTDTYYLRDKSLETDKRVEDYMSLYFPRVKYDTPVTIENKYQLISPTLMAVTYDLINGVIDPDPDMQDVKLMDFMEPYKWFYDYDPALRNYDWRMVSIHPHDSWTPLEVTVKQLRFLERVSREFLKDRVDFTKFYTIKGE